jgi:hypothetical protein
VKLGIDTEKAEIVWENPWELKPNPKNRNQHSDEQIDRLCKLIEYQGFRSPIIVSNRSGCITAGHGRRLAAIKLDMKRVPVIYQDYESDDHEYVHVQSDNAIAEWSELDLSAINADLPELGPFDIDLLGIKNLALDPSEFAEPEDKAPPKYKDASMIECPQCGAQIQKQ